MTTPHQFIDKIRSWPKFIDAVAKDAAFANHLEAIELAINKTSELADTDTVWLGRYDEICALLSNDNMTIKERLLALIELMTPWHAELRGN